MEFNMILAGVGGQGILTIAQAISHAAMRRGYNVKQSEVHGMSQRGGAVQAHLRFADHELHSDLIPLGRADMVLAVEPLESLRYVEYLSEDATIITSSIPFVNIPNYPPIEEVLQRVAGYSDHVVVDAKRLAKAAGSARAENMVMLGAASGRLDFSPADLEAVIAKLFAAKGERIVEINERAFRFGRSATAAYRDCIRRGAASLAVRHWIQSVTPEQLADMETPDLAAVGLDSESCELSPAETHAIGQTISQVLDDDRKQLYEHEVYSIVELVGAIHSPRHLLVRKGERVEPDDLDGFEGDKVVLKIVSPDIVHKTESGGLVFVPNSVDAINREIEHLIAVQSKVSKRIHGVLVVEFIETAKRGLGSELFVGIRATREFGPVIAAGLGGVDTEFLADKMQRGFAVAKASAVDISPDEFFELFKRTAAYELLAGKVRGHERIVSDGELIRCFRAFMAIARRFCIEGIDGTGLLELEVNPFAFAQERPVPLDGRGRLGKLTCATVGRPIAKIDKMLEPKSIAVVGVSGKRQNFGRIILNNIQKCGFPKDRLYVIKDGEKEIDGVPCVPTLEQLPEPVDLLVAATGADQVPALVQDVIGPGATGASRCASVILIPGGLGEKEGTENIQEEIRELIQGSRIRPDGGPVFLGGNCMGMRSRPGCYDTFFIPEAKLDPRRDAPAKRSALISQSGAFIITRMSNLEVLDPTFAISAGNQADLTMSDLLTAVGGRDDIDCVGVYVEGFNDLDGLAFIRAVQRITALGKVVVFYKAGRTSAGRSAAKGHTASVAGDYDVCQAAVTDAGAIVTDTFKEFEQLLEQATAFHGKQVRGRRIGAISNAGYEAVGMADTVKGARYQVEIAKLSDTARQRLSETLAKHRLDNLVNASCPLDLTPMANDEAYEDCIRVMMEDDDIDAVVVGCVPLSPQLLTTPDELSNPGSLVARVPRIFAEYDKPLIFVVDCAAPYDKFARMVREAGVPVFRSADQAIRSLGRYLCHRTIAEEKHGEPALAPPRSEPAAPAVALS